MDISSVIKSRLQELGLEQKALAAAAGVTESYISQLLTGKKLPPAPDRTDIYEKMGQDEYKRAVEEPHSALLKETRELLLSKCVPAKQQQIKSIFEKQTFGELERLVTQKLLDVVSQVVRAELDNQDWLHDVAQLSEKSYEQMRVIILNFLDTDIFNISNEDCISFLNPLIARWDIDLSSFDMEITLNKRLGPGEPKNFAFVERGDDGTHEDQPGLVEFLQDVALSGDVSDEEVEFLRRLRFKARRPNPIYYYRTLQNLRDPLHFRAADE
jgi:transcriptional regulator with XRE-family HTH domain